MFEKSHGRDLRTRPLRPVRVHSWNLDSLEDDIPVIVGTLLTPSPDVVESPPKSPSYRPQRRPPAKWVPPVYPWASLEMGGVMRSLRDSWSLSLRELPFEKA